MDKVIFRGPFTPKIKKRRRLILFSMIYKEQFWLELLLCFYHLSGDIGCVRRADGQLA